MIKKKQNKVKEEPKEKKTKVKKEKPEKCKSKHNDGIIDEASEEHLMSVLELLELQARARAIRSQLALESSKKSKEKEKEIKKDKSADNSDIDDAVIIQSPKNEEIIITSSDSEHDSSYMNEKKKINNETNKEEEINISNRINNSNMEYSRISPSEELGTSKLQYISENPEEINKLLNKFHKMKRRKRKFVDQETSGSEKYTKQKESCKEITESYKSKVMLTTVEYSHEESEKSVANSTSISKLQDVEKPIFGKREDSEMNVFVDHSNGDGDDGIILTVDQAEIDSINLERDNSNNIKSESGKEPTNHIKIIVNELVKPADMSIGEKQGDSSNVNNENMLNKYKIVDKLIIDKERKEIIEEVESIILNVDQSELDSINLD